MNTQKRQSEAATGVRQATTPEQEQAAQTNLTESALLLAFRRAAVEQRRPTNTSKRRNKAKSGRRLRKAYNGQKAANKHAGPTGFTKSVYAKSPLVLRDNTQGGLFPNAAPTPVLKYEHNGTYCYVRPEDASTRRNNPRPDFTTALGGSCIRQQEYSLGRQTGNG